MQSTTKNNQKSAVSAEGVVGHLIYTHSGDYFFRVYDEAQNFVDYKLCHSDLEVKIVDPDAEFYLYEDGSAVLDHSRQTLGL